jgi:hypothetical protein
LICVKGFRVCASPESLALRGTDSAEFAQTGDHSGSRLSYGFIRLDRARDLARRGARHRGLALPDPEWRLASQGPDVTAIEADLLDFTLKA